MPRATVDISKTERHELKSCPGGFVVLRPLSYGEFLRRREMAGSMSINAGTAQGKEVEGVIKMAQRVVTEFEFKNCIVDHNLEDENGNMLDFRQPKTIAQLHPQIGEEIGQYIDGMNQFLTDPNSQGDLETGSELVS